MRKITWQSEKGQPTMRDYLRACGISEKIWWKFSKLRIEDGKILVNFHLTTLEAKDWGKIVGSEKEK